MSGLRGASKQVRRFTGNATSMLGRVGLAAMGLKASLGALEGLAFPIKLAAQAETTAVAFEVMLGSVEKATETIKELRKFTASTPFQEMEVNNAARSMLAFGSNSKSVVKELRTLGDIASGVGIPIGELAVIYGKARVQGRLFAEDVNQLTGRGIPIIQEFARQFKVADSEVKKLVETGKIGFPQVEEAFRSLTSEGGRFFEMTQRQSETTAGLWSTFQDNMLAGLRDIGAALVKELDLKSIIRDMTELAKIFAKDFVPQIASGLKTVVSFVSEMVKGFKKAQDAIKGIALEVTKDLHGGRGANRQESSAILDVLGLGGGGLFGGLFADDTPSLSAMKRRDKGVAPPSILEGFKRRGQREAQEIVGGIDDMLNNDLAKRRNADRESNLLPRIKGVGEELFGVFKSSTQAKFGNLFGGIKGLGESLMNSASPTKDMQQTRMARSLEEGSRESFEVLRQAFGGGNSEQKKTLTATKAIQKASEQAAKHLGKLVNKDGGKMIAKPI